MQYSLRQRRHKHGPKGKERESIYVRSGPKLRKPRKPGTATGLRVKLWAAVLAAETLLYDDGASQAEQIRAVTALTQAAQAYGKLLETADLEARITALEEAQQARDGNLRKVA